ncbi:DUF6236 family protein [Klebsiella michiganensis]|uniref:DUF6236 family protein n=1 Tax=Klebsiella michiganensis TaxID=1134687 RepID=UPI00111804A3|nr:DUF6236 family protein [Klebsiella michiganensis]
MKNILMLQRNVTLKRARRNPNELVLGGAEPIKNINSKILYWDKIVNLELEHIVPNEASYITTLKREGIYESVHIDFYPFPIDNFFIQNFANATKDKIIELLENKSINYVAEDISKDIYFNDCIINQTNGMLMQLANALPFPDDRVPLDKVLEFRLKRKDMLRELLNHINTIELRVSSSENQAHELRAALNEIDIGCTNAIRAYKESGIKFQLTKVEFNFNMKDILAVSGSVFGGASMFLPRTTAASLAVMAGVISTLNISASMQINRIDKKNPFNYTAEINKHLLK